MLCLQLKQSTGKSRDCHITAPAAIALEGVPHLGYSTLTVVLDYVINPSQYILARPGAEGGGRDPDGHIQGVERPQGRV